MEIVPFVSAILGKMSEVGKCQTRFMVDIITLYLSLKSRYTLINMSRYGSYLESTYHEWFRKGFDFVKFNRLLIEEHAGRERFIAFDPSYFSKSGKKTPGVGHFWSGCAGAVKWGLEVCFLAVIDVKHRTGFHYSLQQTQQSLIAAGGGLYKYYAAMLVKHKDLLIALAGNILVVDAFFSNHVFYEAVKGGGFVLLSRMQKRSKMRYKFIGTQRGGRGRHKEYGGKVDVEKLDLQHFCLLFETTKNGITEKCYEAIVHIDSLKVWAKVVIVQNYTTNTQKLKSTQIYFCTDNTMLGEKVLEYYRLRFQIEFLFRDAKQHLGLTHCQSKNENVLQFHWNLALTVLNIAKAVHWLPIAKITKTPFSIQNIKTPYINSLYLNSFISAFGIKTENENNMAIIARLRQWGTMAA